MWGRVAAVVGAKRREAYRQAADLVAVYAEATAIAHGDPAAEDVLTKARQRFPRHIAFRSEVDRAARESPLL